MIRRSMIKTRRTMAPVSREQLIEKAKAAGAPAVCVRWSIEALERWAGKAKS